MRIDIKAVIIGLILGVIACLLFPSIKIQYSESLPCENHSMRMMWLGGKFIYIPFCEK